MVEFTTFNMNMGSQIEILLVDDDEMTLFIHRKILEKCMFKYSFNSFSSGPDCIDYIFKPENLSRKFILLLDINMPEMNGWEVLTELKRLGFDGRGVAIMATSSVDYSDKEKAKSFDSVIDFLVKPLSILTLQEVVNKPEINFLSKVNQ